MSKCHKFTSLLLEFTLQSSDLFNLSLCVCVLRSSALLGEDREEWSRGLWNKEEPSLFGTCAHHLLIEGYLAKFTMESLSVETFYFTPLSY